MIRFGWRPPSESCASATVPSPLPRQGKFPEAVLKLCLQTAKVPSGLVPPMAWLVLAYLGSLAVLLVSAFWTTNKFTGAVVHTFTSDNIVRVLTDAVFRTSVAQAVGHKPMKEAEFKNQAAR